ncbi:MAG: hypothetical protein E7054_07400 [Lentisphaerae bacterium]|nr:hypothetical protein [Lentisphaerota bacterium]
MIVPMKKVTLLAMAKDEQRALEILRDLGVMQLVQTGKYSSAAQNSLELYTSACRLARQLDALRSEEAELVPETSAERGKAVLESAAELFERKLDLEMELSTLDQRLDRLAVWGDFKMETIETLRSKGVTVLLCSGSRDEFEAAKLLDDVSIFPVRENRSMVDFAAVITGDAKDISGKLPVFRLADDDDPASLKCKYLEVKNRLEQTEKTLHDLSCETESIELYCTGLSDAAEFDRAADAMQEYGEISVLNGFVPQPEIEALRNAAKQHGWGLLIVDPTTEDEDVPVLLKNNRFTRIIKPLFDFLGIAPGYWEIDISGGVLIFFTIFYAIIVGDAGYGVLFGIISLFGLRAAKRKPALLAPMRLLLVLSVAATIWGALCGSWFGLSTIPGTQIAIPGLECFRDFASSTAKQANIQFFCFILAVCQLSIGRIWRTIRERNWRSAISNFGWMLIVWGNFFLTVRLIVYPGEFPKFMYALYGAGLLLVMICGVNWKNAAAIFQFPFDIIGSFTDVLSYIRLFAVSLAGACIAGSFNGMGFNLGEVSVWLIPAGLLVAAIGHVLNIALALLSVLVHGVRLNTLEFSNHTGLSWSGQAFDPFKKSKK